MSLTLLLPTTAAADQPTAEILYYTVDYEGGEPRRGRLMDAGDLEHTVNRARCECGQEIWARVMLGPGDHAGRQIETYVGRDCDEAQDSLDPALRPCVRLMRDFGQSYQRGLDLLFHPIWLARGVEDGQSVDEAVAYGGCSAGRGEGGIWICVESNGVVGCQAEEFVVRGDRNENAPDSGGLRYDFDAPSIVVDDIRIERSSDGEILVEWTAETPSPDGGFRILCADEHGDPVVEPPFQPPTLTQPHLGTIYFTRENLCGETPFSRVDATEPPAETRQGITGLDWDYVCSDHLPYNATRARIAGAADAQQFLLVAYDRAGNPTILSEVLTPTSDDDLELSDRGCGCRSSNPTPLGLAWLAVLPLWWLRRRPALIGTTRRRRPSRRRADSSSRCGALRPSRCEGR